MSLPKPQPEQSAVAKRVATASDSQLMPPPPPPKHIKRPATVLEEDDYTSALSHIIARDFFPGLVETQAQQEYLDALESNDKAWISNAGKRMAEAMTPKNGTRGRRGVSYTPKIARGTPSGMDATGDTPSSMTAGMGLSTPLSTAGTDVTTEGPGRDKRFADEVRNMSLSEFQATFTSEDNESFNKILDKSNHKRREKYGWIWNGNKIPSAKQIAHHKREAKRIEAQPAPSASNTELIKSDMDARPAQLDSWKSKAPASDVDGSVKNALMFAPTSIDGALETRRQVAEAVSHMGPKATSYQNTRMPQVLETSADTVRPPSPTLSSIRDAIAGHARFSESEAGFSGNETPRVNGYAFVHENEPGGGEEYYRKFLKSSGDSGPNPFKITENRKREELHHRMVHRVAKTKREEEKSAISGMSSASRRGTPGSVGALTPAARRLFKQVGRTPRHNFSLSALSSSSSSVSKDMWTPNRTAHRKSKK